MDAKTYSVGFRFSEPLSISFKTFEYSEHIMLVIKDRLSGVEGYGESAAFKPITKDTRNDNIAYFTMLKALRNIPLGRIGVEDIPDYIPKSRSQTSMAGFDIALHDMIGKREGKPVSALYAGRAKRVPNTITIFIRNMHDTSAKTHEILSRYKGIKAIKIKLQGNKGDFERVKNVVDLCPRGTKFILDANRGFKESGLAIKVVNEISDYTRGVVLLEEPCACLTPRGLRKIKENITVPLFADDSVRTIKDAEKLVEADAISGINIKIQKMGGIAASRRLAEYAAENNLKLMVGCMFETPISISAGVHFAASTKNVIMTDLDYDLELPDYFKGRALFKNGYRMPNKKAGLGVEFDIERLGRIADRKLITFSRLA